MGFRDPLTSFPADAITGLIQGTQLAADSIDGKTITGAIIRTSATGRRLVLDPVADELAIYSGSSAETAHGLLSADVTTTLGVDTGHLRLHAPNVGGGFALARIDMDSAASDGSLGSVLGVLADQVNVGATFVAIGGASGSFNVDGGGVSLNGHGGQFLTIDPTTGVLIIQAPDITLNTRSLPRGVLTSAENLGTVSAPNATPVTVLTAPAFTLATARKVRVSFGANQANGTTGGEEGRLTLGGLMARRCSWQSVGAGAAGEASPGTVYPGTLAAGTYTPSLTVLRVAGGTQVNASGGYLLVEDMGA